MITINRAYLSDCTISQVTSGKFKCLGLELPWKSNKSFVSCVPEGEYKYRIAKSPRTGKNVIMIDNVPKRECIQIHAGNYTSKIRGCCLVGDSIKDINHDGVLDVTNSVATLNKLLSEIDSHGTITFRGASI